eukprot:scaffold8014_cov248-Pinguiococcus_pyrenoidosus.AAC.3
MSSGYFSVRISSAITSNESRLASASRPIFAALRLSSARRGKRRTSGQRMSPRASLWMIAYRCRRLREGARRPSEQESASACQRPQTQNPTKQANLAAESLLSGDLRAHLQGALAAAPSIGAALEIALRIPPAVRIPRAWPSERTCAGSPSLESPDQADPGQRPAEPRAAAGSCRCWHCEERERRRRHHEAHGKGLSSLTLRLRGYFPLPRQWQRQSAFPGAPRSDTHPWSEPATSGRICRVQLKTLHTGTDLRQTPAQHAAAASMLSPGDRSGS